MAQEILTPNLLQTNVGPFRDFNGNPLIPTLEDLSDGNSGTGIQTDSNTVATINFSFTSPLFTTFDTAILQYRIEELASGGKGTIITTFSLSAIPIETFNGSEVPAGTIEEVDIGNLSIEQINNGIFGFNISNTPNITRISEVKIILTITGGQVRITQGKINLKKGKILI